MPGQISGWVFQTKTRRNVHINIKVILLSFRGTTQKLVGSRNAVYAQRGSGTIYPTCHRHNHYYLWQLDRLNRTCCMVLTFSRRQSFWFICEDTQSLCILSFKAILLKSQNHIYFYLSMTTHFGLHSSLSGRHYKTSKITQNTVWLYLQYGNSYVYDTLVTIMWILSYTTITNCQV
jgi:hypothetical protein